MNAEKKAAIAARLELIASKNAGRLTPEDVVADAKSKASPLHDQFTWDDREAAAAHRLDQARTLIRVVRVEVSTETRIIQTVRYVRDPSAGSDEQGYVDVLALRDETELAREALASEFTRAHAMMSRAVDLADALGLRAEVADIADRIDKIRGKLSLVA